MVIGTTSAYRLSIPLGGLLVFELEGSEVRSCQSCRATPDHRDSGVLLRSCSSISAQLEITWQYVWPLADFAALGTSDRARNADRGEHHMPGSASPCSEELPAASYKTPRNMDA